jgi:hypothetical protein
MVLKNEKAPVFLNVNKLEIGLLMNGFPFKHFLNCNNNPNRIKKRLFQGHKHSYSQNQSISKEFFQQEYQREFATSRLLRDLFHPNGLRENQ